MTVHWTRRQLLRLAGTATLTGALTGALKAEGIEMPYPHRVLEIKRAKHG